MNVLRNALIILLFSSTTTMAAPASETVLVDGKDLYGRNVSAPAAPM